jgi:hypothetical protein
MSRYVFFGSKLNFDPKNNLGFRNWRLIEDVLKKIRDNKKY